MKEKVNLTLEGDLWRAFRSACITRGIRSASSEIEEFIRERLQQWGVTVEEEQPPKKGGTRKR